MIKHFQIILLLMLAIKDMEELKIFTNHRIYNNPNLC